MCGRSEENQEKEYIQQKAQEAINNLKFLNLGIALMHQMTPLEQKVFYMHQIQREKFKDIGVVLHKSEATIKKAWQRCKSRGDKVLEESVY
tara:strand:- start:491 stop:763 length:273 start_codon:yes stop_codon:yes gene_type:complete